jgi:hypothetical protein
VLQHEVGALPLDAVEVDDDESAARLERREDRGEVLLRPLEVVVDVADEDDVDARGRQTGRVVGALHHVDVRQRLEEGALPQVFDELGRDLEREDAPGRPDARREERLEEAGAGADVGDPHPRRELARRRDQEALRRDLALVALEVRDPFADVRDVAELLVDLRDVDRGDVALGGRDGIRGVLRTVAPRRACGDEQRGERSAAHHVAAAGRAARSARLTKTGTTARR